MHKHFYDILKAMFFSLHAASDQLCYRLLCSALKKPVLQSVFRTSNNVKLTVAAFLGQSGVQDVWVVTLVVGSWSMICIDIIYGSLELGAPSISTSCRWVRGWPSSPSKRVESCHERRIVLEAEERKRNRQHFLRSLWKNSTEKNRKNNATSISLLGEIGAFICDNVVSFRTLFL